MLGSARFVDVMTELKMERENLVHVVRELVEKLMPELGPEVACLSCSFCFFCFFRKKPNRPSISA